MYLSIYSKTRDRVINLNSEFFTDSKIIKGGAHVTLTPAKKAKDLAEDLEGENLIGFELRKENKVISQSGMVEVRALKAKAAEQREKSLTVQATA